MAVGHSACSVRVSDPSTVCAWRQHHSRGAEWRAFLSPYVMCAHWQSSLQPATSADARLPATYQRTSSFTDNMDCPDCISPGHVANSTELHLHPNLDDDDELLRYIWKEYLHPKQYEWALIVAYIIVFFVSLIGNSLGKSANF